MTRELREMRIGIATKLIPITKMAKDETAKTNGVSMIMMYFVLSIFLTAFLGSVLDSIHAIDTTNMSTSEIAIVGSFGVFILIGIMYVIMPPEIKKV